MWFLRVYRRLKSLRKTPAYFLRFLYLESNRKIVDDSYCCYCYKNYFVRFIPFVLRLESISNSGGLYGLLKGLWDGYFRCFSKFLLCVK